jgi:hypothetical protein
LGILPHHIFHHISPSPKPLPEYLTHRLSATLLHLYNQSIMEIITATIPETVFECRAKISKLMTKEKSYLTEVLIDHYMMKIDLIRLEDALEKFRK